MSTIKEYLRIHKKAFLLSFIIFLVATLSFGLGYLANQEFNPTPIIIQNNPPS